MTGFHPLTRVVRSSMILRSSMTLRSVVAVASLAGSLVLAGCGHTDNSEKAHNVAESASMMPKTASSNSSGLSDHPSNDHSKRQAPDYDMVAAQGKGAAATVHPLATKAAIEVLESGGNAVDAAVAAALMLGVVDGHNSGIGGGLFALVYWADGRVEAVDGREMAPAKAHRDMYLKDGEFMKDWSRTGPLASGVPGSIAVFDYLMKNGGAQTFADHLERAATVADEGFVVTPVYAKRLRSSAEALGRFPASKVVFFSDDGETWSEGDILKQKDLAATYRAIAKEGSAHFYQGEFAKAVGEWMAANGGLITVEDMANYEIKLRNPIQSTYQGHTIYGFPPPSSGGVHVAEMLNILEHFSLKGLSDSERYHLVGEAMKLAFADRAHWLGDPAYTHVPKGLTSKEYADQLASKISSDKALASVSYGKPKAWDSDWFQTHTTNISVADGQGNWVALTTTVNTNFGSKVIIPGTGVIMNNQMDDFSAQPGVPNVYGLVGSEANSIQPGKRPLSSMTPTIVVKNDDNGKPVNPVMAIGAAGGPLIITQVLQGIVNHITLDYPLQESLAAPRIHQQWKPEVLFVEQVVDSETREALEAKGHKVMNLRFTGSSTAVVQKNSGEFVPVAEPRLRERNQ
ncbi:gamma-glutamyltransferase [Marinibactrum halimedae]|uniref:Glutathione hydrolase proenzyme n=1 Tax=Marinibactrum halimedae TaxID=1444977 RepID=A0AA37TBX7_9GAMM|nr:gamma-glutamyltransferase [Marinibactrum halimedae]MCD9460589.1 gamma-glutamyltransferase [Marinibactrum halimedae]GLS27220.1 gamma-glutamyltransferase [Marinibactrum halimedae]